MNSPWQNKALLYKLYIVECCNAYQIANIWKCRHTTIYKWLRKHGIKVRSASEKQTGSLNHRFVPLEVRLYGSDMEKSRDCCWFTEYVFDKDGYKHIKVNGRVIGAHIVSWELHNGRKVKDGYVVHHLCRNKECVNPYHLRELILKDHQLLHIKDHPSGEQHGRAKLTIKQIKEIRGKYIGTWGQITQLAKEYNVSFTTMSYIINKKTYTNV